MNDKVNATYYFFKNWEDFWRKYIPVAARRPLP
jgi:hypothetical protein